MPRQRSKKQGRRRARGRGSSSSASSGSTMPAQGSSSGASSMALPFDLSLRPRYAPTSYMSPWCAPLRTKAWLAFDGLPPHLWTKRTCESAVAPFGGVVRFHVPPSDGDGRRLVLEARIRRPEDVPRRIDARHHLGFGHFLTWHVDVEILAYAPVGDDDETAPPGALVMWCANPEDEDFAIDDDGEEPEVGKPKRVTYPAPTPEECVGILGGGGEASGAVERPASNTCQAFSDDWQPWDAYVRCTGDGFSAAGGSASLQYRFSYDELINVLLMSCFGVC